MKAKKAIVIQLMKDLEGPEITKKILDDYIRSLADEDAGFESKVFVMIRIPRSTRKAITP